MTNNPPFTKTIDGLPAASLPYLGGSLLPAAVPNGDGTYTTDSLMLSQLLSGVSNGVAFPVDRTALSQVDVTQTTQAFFDGSSWVWEVGNFTAAIAADPTQGIYVPWAGDSAPGATGAWVRQVVIDILDNWFQTVGNGTTDDLLPLTGLWNYCIANPGKIGRLDSGLTYGISAPLPVINKSGVKIMGPDVGLFAAEAGPIIKAIGSFSGDIVALYPNAAANTLSGITLDGFTLHGNRKANHGLMALSFVESVINLTGIDCLQYDGYFACVNYGLATAPDTQRNRIRFKSQNIAVDAPGAYFGWGTGNGGFGADFSLNEVEMLELINDASGGTAIPLVIENTDSSNWRSISTVAQGTYGALIKGSTTVGVGASSNEIFHDYVSNKPMHVQAGTVSSPKFIILDVPNESNGTPTTVADIGVGYTDMLWRNYTPTLSYETPGSQVFTSTSAKWRRASPTQVDVVVIYVVTTAGTGRVTVNLPMVPQNAESGWGTSINAEKALNVYVPSGSSTGYMNIADGTSIPSGAIIVARFTMNVNYVGLSLI